MEKVTVSITLVERSTGSGMLVILIVQALNLFENPRTLKMKAISMNNLT